jgi:chromosome segregation ATPase
MTKEIIIIVLILALIYLYYQNRKLKQLPHSGNSTQTIFNYESDSDDEVPFPSRQKLQHELQQALELVKKLKENKDIPEDYQELETERDEAIREKQTAEQEVLSLSNKLKLKNQEVNRKDDEIQRIKKEKTDKEIALNKTITNLKKEHEELKKKYSKRTSELDEEQTDNNKLTEKIEELENKIQELEKQRTEMPGS